MQRITPQPAVTAGAFVVDSSLPAWLGGGGGNEPATGRWHVRRYRLQAVQNDLLLILEDAVSDAASGTDDKDRDVQRRQRSAHRRYLIGP